MRRLTFTNRSPVGDLYERPVGKVQWKKLGPAVGEFTMHPETEYRLKLRGSFFGTSDALQTLTALPGLLSGRECVRGWLGCRGTAWTNPLQTFTI